MDIFGRAMRPVASVAILALAACGGGAGSNPNTTGQTAGNTTGNTSGNTMPTVSIGAPDNANVAIAGATFDFVTNLPPVRMVFGLLGPAVKVTSTTVEAANKGSTGTLTYRGTPVARVPTSGSATYTGTGTVNGTYAIPSGANAIEMGTLNGDVSLTANFANNTASGSLTNMKAQAADGSTTAPWNDVFLAGTLTRGTTGVTMNGLTSTSTNTGPAGFSAAHGHFNGALYGPTAQEAAGAWTLSETTTGGGKAAFGTFGAHNSRIRDRQPSGDSGGCGFSYTAEPCPGDA